MGCGFCKSWFAQFQSPPEREWDNDGGNIRPWRKKKLAKQLAAFLRKKRGDLTYQQFSRKTGLSDSTLHRLELGDQNITLKTLEHICERLKCGVAAIFEE